MFFAAQDYYFIPALYGGKQSNYMGVAVAIPTIKYDILQVDVHRVSDTKKFAWEVRPDRNAGLSLYDSLMAPFRYFFPPPVDFRVEFKPWTQAKNRYNKMVAVRVRDKQSQEVFWVGTYHMPCLFGDAEKRSVMVIHAALVAQQMEKLAKKTKEQYVLAGDFNFKPEDSSYLMLTQGLSESHEDFPRPEADAPKNCLQISQTPKLQSAYALAGGEPAYTNHAQVKNEEPFIGCLDYVFLSQGWKVQSVVPMSTTNLEEGPFPTEREPSDHMLLGAELRL